jgi:predicted TIM-barrel fold metal-dependent hydrolase
MPIIDAQVHAYEANHRGRPWVNDFGGPEHVTGDEMVAAMDRVGVDGAILVSSFTYGYDPSYALEVQAKHPTRFALVRPVDPTDPAVADVVADWAGRPGAVGLRVILNFAASRDPADLGLNRVLAAAAEHKLVVNLLVGDRLELAHALSERNPDTVIAIDHLGLRPFHPPSEPWADLPMVLSLARCDNVHIKLTGVCTLSHKPFPYDDIWDPVLRIIDAFGLDRCMWGTDWTRATHRLSYEQGVDAFRTTSRLSETDRAQLMGGTLARLYGWAPSRDRG